jgi:hypothetical protein
MTTFFLLLGAAVLWALYELFGTIADELLRAVLGPVLRPAWRVVGPVLRAVRVVLSPVLWPLNRAAEGPVGSGAVVLLWVGALASYAFLPYSSSEAASPAARAIGLVAFLLMTPLAVGGTLALRHPRRPDGVLRRGDHYVPPPGAGSR